MKGIIIFLGSPTGMFFSSGFNTGVAWVLITLGSWFALIPLIAAVVTFHFADERFRAEIEALGQLAYEAGQASKDQEDKV